jgi:hypothetical protein
LAIIFWSRKTSSDDQPKSEIGLTIDFVDLFGESLDLVVPGVLGGDRRLESRAELGLDRVFTVREGIVEEDLDRGGMCVLLYHGYHNVCNAYA